MIADLDETILQLLKRELPVRNSEVEISFEQPKRENSARWVKPTINLFLFDLRENNVLRQPQWERLHGGNGNTGLSHKKRSPIRVDCHYMLTTWATDPEDEHRLLTRALLTLSRFPLLPDDSLVGSLRHPPFDIQARLANHDKLTNPAEVWSALDNEIRPSISYIITLALDPWQEISGPIVRTRTLRTGQVDKSPRSGHLQPQAQNELVRIGGFVRQKDKSQAPVVGIQVGIKGTAFLAESDEAGQFSLGSVAPGEYTLVAWSTNGRPQEINITVPTNKGNYDIEI